MTALTRSCPDCGGEGRKIKSRYGGNDPDTWDAGPCERCEETGYVLVFCELCGEFGAEEIVRGDLPMHASCAQAWRDKNP